MQFHVIIHALATSADPARRPSELEATQELAVNPDDLVPFKVSFEEIAEHFAQWPRMFLEPDGSFVWVLDRGGVTWQLDGSLQDNGSHLLHVELKGTCDRFMLDSLLQALGWPSQRLIFQLVRQGVYVDEAEFRRLVVS